MKKILYLFLLLLPVVGFAQSRYGVEGVPMCWTTALGVDSSIIRYVLVSTTGQPVKTIVHENASGAVVNVTGGTLKYGFCDCAGGGALDSIANGSVTWAKLANAVKDSIRNLPPFYLLGMGQSNFWGATPAYQGDTTGSAHVKILDETTNTIKRARIGQTPFRVPSYNGGSAIYNNSNNLALHAAKKIYEETGREVIILMVTEDGAAGTNRGEIGRWANINSKPMWDTLQNRVVKLQTLDPNFKKFDAFFWHQGESNNLYYHYFYKNQFDTLLSNLRAEDWFPANTPVVVGGLLQGGIASRQDSTLQELDKIGDAYVGYADSYGLVNNGIDNIHFSGNSLVELGKRYVITMNSLPKRFIESRDSNGIISILPTRNVTINAANHSLTLKSVSSFNLKLGSATNFNLSEGSMIFNRSDQAVSYQLGGKALRSFYMFFRTPYQFQGHQIVWDTAGVFNGLSFTRMDNSFNFLNQMQLYRNGDIDLGDKAEGVLAPQTTRIRMLAPLEIQTVASGAPRYQFPYFSAPAQSINAKTFGNWIGTGPGTNSGFIRYEAIVATGNTDANGDIVVTFPSAFPDDTYSAVVTIEDTTASSLTCAVREKTASGFKVRIRNSTTGAALTSTSVVINYHAIDY